MSAALCALAAAGCGSAPPAELPAPTGPEPSPPLTAKPAGRVVPARALSREPGAVRTGGRDYSVDERRSRLVALEGGRRVASVPTALQPRGLAVSGEGRAIAVLSVRERALELFDAATLRRVGEAAAGTGPANVASDGGNYLYVTDTKAGALLVFRTVPELRLTRRYPLAGGPYDLAYDPGRRRIWVTLTATNQIAELTAGARPRELRRLPAVRQPAGVAVEPRSGRVLVAGASEGNLQVLDPPRPPRTR
jgi:DNA-binding beta-propeller fold protein YncE